MGLRKLGHLGAAELADSTWAIVGLDCIVTPRLAIEGSPITPSGGLSNYSQSAFRGCSNYSRFRAV